LNSFDTGCLFGLRWCLFGLRCYDTATSFCWCWCWC
jgi:hypothetical protein